MNNGYINRVIDISLYFFVIFIATSILCYFDFLKCESDLFKIFEFGFILYWVYAGLVVLHLCGILVLEKRRFTAIIITELVLTSFYIFINQREFYL